MIPIEEVIRRENVTFGDSRFMSWYIDASHRYGIGVTMIMIHQQDFNKQLIAENPQHLANSQDKFPERYYASFEKFLEKVVRNLP